MCLADVAILAVDDDAEEAGERGRKTGHVAVPEVDGPADSTDAPHPGVARKPGRPGPNSDGNGVNGKARS